jgi:hypothetical protein
LLLFALVLGLSALVASIAPPPETDDEDPPAATVTGDAPPSTVPGTKTVVLSARETPEEAPPRRVPVGSSFVLEVPVPEPGDVVVDRLGLRQYADRLTPARFTILAEPPGRYEVAFAPVQGERRIVGSVAFVEPEAATPRRPGR